MNIYTKSIYMHNVLFRGTAFIFIYWRRRRSRKKSDEPFFRFHFARCEAFEHRDQLRWWLIIWNNSANFECPLCHSRAGNSYLTSIQACLSVRARVYQPIDKNFINLLHKVGHKVSILWTHFHAIRFACVAASWRCTVFIPHSHTHRWGFMLF